MNKVMKALGVSFVVIVARLLPLSPIIGSLGATFSWSSIFAPVIASQCGLGWVLGFFLSKKLLLAPSYMVLIHRMPLLFASRVFQKQEKIFSVLLPIACMMLFFLHPTGAHAWPYALYWFIPIILSFVGNGIWVRGLQASFVAHAVGSIIWLYTGSISADVWISLIPIVACERLLIAGGIVVTNKICYLLMNGCLLAYHRFIFIRRVVQ